MVTNDCVKLNYDRLRIDKALGNFRNLMTTTSIRGPFSGPTVTREPEDVTVVYNTADGGCVTLISFRVNVTPLKTAVTN